MLSGFFISAFFKKEIAGGMHALMQVVRLSPWELLEELFRILKLKNHLNTSGFYNLIF
jgi:hypothetical protein